MPADESRGPTDPSGTPETLRKENDSLRERVAQLERERDRLRRENERLRKDLEAARRAGYRQAAPFSRGAPSSTSKRPGRKAGTAYGRYARRPVPKQIDERYEAAVRRTCPHCHGTITNIDVVSQYQEDLPPVRPMVREFRIEVGFCSRCRRRIQARHPLQTSDAVGAAAVQFGPQVISLATVLHAQLGVPLGKVATLFHQTFQLTVTPGGIIRAFTSRGQTGRTHLSGLGHRGPREPLRGPR